MRPTGFADRLGIGIIGAGNIVKRHALAYRSLSELARPVGVADLELARARAARDRFGFACACADYAELLARDDVHVVSVCTPANTHARIAVDALAAGKHVLCEKPLATTLADADRIIAASDSRPRQTVSCVFQLRADPVHQRMRWLISEGWLGRILLARVCVRLRKSSSYYHSAPGRGAWRIDGGGVLINQGIHQLDALLSFLGEPAETGGAMDTFLQPIEAEDTLVGWVRFNSDALATIECTTCAKKKEFSIDVVGERAAMRVSGDPDTGNFVWRLDAAGTAAKRAMVSAGVKAFPDPKNANGVARAAGKLIAKLRRRDARPERHWGHTPFVEQFLLAAREGRSGPVPPREARRSVALAAALYESALTRRVVSWPMNEDSGVYGGIESAGLSVVHRTHPRAAGSPAATTGAVDAVRA